MADAIRIVPDTATQTQNNSYFVHTDHLDTPRLITSYSNQKRWSWYPENSEAFGANLPNENPATLGVFTYNLRFPGQLYDPQSQLSYNYYRDYNPRTGRYIESDPIGLAGGINTYAYVEGNPLSFTDRFGEAKDKYQKPANPNKKHPTPEHRIPSGQRERNVGHPEDEEHSRVPKGNRGPRGGRGAGCFFPIIMFTPPEFINENLRQFDEPDLSELFPPA